MPEYTNLRLEKHGHTAVLTLENPPANAWTLEALRDMHFLVEELNQDREIYSLVITGQGNKFFCAGADINMFAEGDKVIAREVPRRFGEAFENLSRFRGVSIAAINGYCMGGGLELALSCDLRIAEDSARMGLPEAKIGLLPCAAGTQTLAWLVGEAWAKRMILCGQQVDAETALRIGLVEEISGKGQALDKALELAACVARQSPISVTACKQLIQSARQRPMVDNLAAEREAFVDLFDTHDQHEGVTAFLEKRQPRWHNA